MLTTAGVTESIVVDGAGSRIDARAPGFATRFGAAGSRRHSREAVQFVRPGEDRTGDLAHVPRRRQHPRVGPRFGRGSESVSHRWHQRHCHGQWRRAGGSRHRLHSGTANPVGGRVGRVRQRPGRGCERHHQIWRRPLSIGHVVLLADLRADQPTGATPVQGLETGYEREKYRDFSSSFGGPGVRDRLWFFSGYQHQRDSDSQPGTDPTLPRHYEQDKIFAKLTTRLAPGWQLVQSVHGEFWSNPETPSATKPRDATQQLDASVPA